jgi:hypothetical protein
VKHTCLDFCDSDCRASAHITGNDSIDHAYFFAEGEAVLVDGNFIVRVFPIWDRIKCHFSADYLLELLNGANLTKKSSAEFCIRLWNANRERKKERKKEVLKDRRITL